MQLLALVPLLIGSLVAVVGVLGRLERLPRNRFGGVRTTATMRSDVAFRTANRVAGPPIAIGGLVGLVGGVAALLMPGTGGVLTGVAIGLLGMVAITMAGGLLGHRVAQAVPDEPPPVPAGCGGCACGSCPIRA